MSKSTSWALVLPLVVIAVAAATSPGPALLIAGLATGLLGLAAP